MSSLSALINVAGKAHCPAARQEAAPLPLSIPVTEGEMGGGLLAVPQSYPARAWIPATAHYKASVGGWASANSCFLVDCEREAERAGEAEMGRSQKAGGRQRSLAGMRRQSWRVLLGWVLAERCLDLHAQKPSSSIWSLLGLRKQGLIPHLLGKFMHFTLK